jgi:streptogramin lyase
MKTVSKMLGLIATGVLAINFSGQAHAAPHYRLESAVTLPAAAPSWDYLAFDSTRSRLFIARRADGVTVYDAVAGRAIGDIANSQGANATLLIPEFDRGYTTNGDGSTTIFSLSDLKTIRRAKIGESADAGFYEPVSKQIVFTMGDDKAIAFFDAKSGIALGKLEMSSEKLEATAVDGNGNVYIAQRDRNSIVRIDVAHRKITAEWKVANCEQPTGLAIDRANQRLFAGCRGKEPVMAVVRYDSGTTVGTFQIGRGNDGVIYDAQTKRIFTSNGIDGNVVIFEQSGPDAYALVEAVTTRPMARTMAYDPVTKKIFLVTAEGVADPAKKINTAVAPFYPNSYYPGTFTVLTYGPTP